VTDSVADRFPDLAGIAAAAGPNAISLSDVDFHYPNGHQALAGFSMRVAHREIVGVIGPSGCGKSTLLQVIAGLSLPSRGTVTVDVGSTGRPGLTEVFQKDTLLPWLRVRDNVALYFKFHHAGRREVAERVDELLDMVGLQDFADAYPYQLSGGMRRRVAFLAGIAPDPQVLLLDEPFSSVDEPSRVDIHRQVLEVLRQRKTTAILVTHDLAEAVTLSDRVVILSAGPGRVVADHPVPFGDQRDVLELRKEPAFLDLYGRLWADLSAQIEIARGNHDARGTAPP
jgi:NitT/TauT family transport system ATP-binding protein